MVAVNGHVFHSHGSALRSWRGAIVDGIREQELDLKRLTDVPVLVHLSFRLPRPKTTTRKKPSVRPDIDKLSRAVLDALVEAGVVKDDGQVTTLIAEKLYADPEHERGVNILVKEEEAAR